MEPHPIRTPRFARAALLGASVLCLLSCDGWADRRAGDLPDLLLPADTPVAVATSAPLAEDYFYPAPGWEETGSSRRSLERCQAGEDVRSHFAAVAAVIDVRGGKLRLGGESVVDLDGWAVPDEALRGTLISPLFDALKELADESKSAAERESCWGSFDGRLLLALPAASPGRLVRQVAYTAGQAQFGELAMAVIDPAAVAAAEARVGGEPAAATPPPAPDAASTEAPPAEAASAQQEGSHSELDHVCVQISVGPPPRCSDFLDVQARSDGGVSAWAVASHGGLFDDSLDRDSTAIDLPAIEGEPDIKGLTEWAAGLKRADPVPQGVRLTVTTEADSRSNGDLAVLWSALAAAMSEARLGFNLSVSGDSDGHLLRSAMDPATAEIVVPARDRIAVIDWHLPPLSSTCTDPGGRRVVRDLLSDASSLSADVGAALAQSSGVAVARRDGAAPGLREGADRAASSGEGTAARVRGRVATGAVEMSGEPEDEVSIQRTMKRYTGRAKQCYERELKGDPGLAGKVSVSFDIDTFGRVTGVAVIQNTTGDAELAACIKRVVQRIRFNPPPEDDVEVSAYPFILSLQ